MPKINILERYIFRECFSSFLIAIGVITAIMFLGTSFKLLSSTKGLDMVSVVEVAPFVLPYVVVHALPLAVLIGTLSGYTRLSSDREITAMKLTGVPLSRLVSPAVFLGLALALISLMTSNYLTPMSRHHLNRFVKRAVTKIITQLGESRNSIEYDGPKFKWKFHWKEVRDGKLRDLVIYKVPRTPATRAADSTGATEPAEIIYASSGMFRLDSYDNLIKFELEGLLGYFDLGARPDPRKRKAGAPEGGLEDTIFSGDRDRKLGFRGGNFAVTVNLDVAEAKDDMKIRAKDRDLDNLMALRARNLKSVRVSRLSIDVEIHRRVSQALSSLSLALLGAALGLLFKGPNRILAYLTGFIVALVVYFPLTRVGEGAAEAGALPPWFSLEFGNAAVWLLCLVLFRRGGR